jgi:DNA invertase Pin-like site-specific DNA recombinase
MAQFGYARVSTDGQSLTAQVAELKAASCQRIFHEKISGARSDRKQLTQLIAGLDKGDVLVATRLDRLARSTRDLLNILGAVAEKGAGFKSLRDSWADSTTPTDGSC